MAVRALLLALCLQPARSVVGTDSSSLLHLPTCVVNKNWAGVNSYFAWALDVADQETILSNMEKRGLKVMRIFVATVPHHFKGTSAQFVPHLEPDHMGDYNVTVLNLINDFMVRAKAHNIKLNIVLHDRYALGCWSCDGYQKDLGLSCITPHCGKEPNDVRKFYTDALAIKKFDERLLKILTYVNPTFGKPWGHLPEVVAMFAPQNEAQGLDPHFQKNWTCARAAVMRKVMDPQILIATGGGRTFEESSWKEHFECSVIDVVTLHDYEVANWTPLMEALGRAKALALQHGKRVIFEEFGSKDKEYRPDYFYSTITASVHMGMPFMPWEYMIPGDTKSDDYEFDTYQASWAILVYGAIIAKESKGAFSWPNIL
ncbi:unnamed protein product [Effrenium voratum]|uniref:Glycoside hydrolase family 5 domain-containing protein n=1 Tax=Effrenium voratum TaxID=2562239 RepID=A0AA36JS29_9DINO|nr:unnamed protein product [Effrenium voratum]CAJ1416657.1 unnamed protein product [Effrenium voratum]